MNTEKEFFEMKEKVSRRNKIIQGLRDALKKEREKEIIVVKIDDDDSVYANGRWIGVLKNTVGPYGESTGEFRRCETTTPINEIIGGEGIILVSEKGVKLPNYM